MAKATSHPRLPTNVSEEQLRDAPEFSDDSWANRDWETRMHKHHGAPAYW
jgi:hypothetical protein